MTQVRGQKGLIGPKLHDVGVGKGPLNVIGCRFGGAVQLMCGVSERSKPHQVKGKHVFGRLGVRFKTCEIRTGAHDMQRSVALIKSAVLALPGSDGAKLSAPQPVHEVHT